MSIASGLSRRFAVAGEFWRMIRERKAYLLAPLLVFILLILIFMFVGEMPVLIPFFYAVF